MSARVRAAAAAVAALVLAGCATVPEETDVQVERQVPAGPQPALASGPEPGVDPFRLVRDFLKATAEPQDGHAAARSFLTATAGAEWDDDQTVVVVEDAPRTTPLPSTTPGTTKFQVLANRIGELRADGTFAPGADVVQRDLEVVREGSEWRIANPTAGVLVESAAFQRSYRQVRVSFLDQTGASLVTDVRWVAARDPATLASRVLDLLLAGPSEALAGAVTTAVPDGARPRSNELVGDDGRAVLDLAGVGALGEAERRRLAAQLVSTLERLVPAPIRLFADGAPLVPGTPDWTVADIASYAAGSAPQPDAPDLAVVGGRLVGLDGVAVDGPAGDGDPPVRTAALSTPAGERVATVVVGDGGRPQLRIGPVDGEQAVVPLEAETMTRPTWRPGGQEVWTVLDGATVASVALDTDGRPVPAPVDAAELAALGQITDLRLSRDGARVAAVVGGKLVVAAVTVDAGIVSVRRPQVLRAGDLPASAVVDWARPDQLLVASAGPVAQVSAVSVDGLTRRAVETTNLSGPLTGVAAAPGREWLAADEAGLWRYSETQEVWEPVEALTGAGPGAVPLYPG